MIRFYKSLRQLEELCIEIERNGKRMNYLILGIFIVLLIIDIIYENKHLVIQHYTVENNKIPKKFNDKKFVVLADLHGNSYGKNNEKLLNKIYEINPDFIIVAGDMLVASKSYDDKVAFSLLKTLAKKYQIYYGYGNHEQRIMLEGEHHHKEINQYFHKLSNEGVQFLKNRSLELTMDDEKIRITGLYIDRQYYKRGKLIPFTKDYLKKNIGKSSEQCYNILIAHNPIYFKDYVNWGADLIISGHIHGGLIRIPFIGGMLSPRYRFFPKYDSGRFEMMNKIMLVSRGLGMHTIKIRVNNHPELMVVHLKHFNGEVY